ncbi:hypothetical protein [Methanosarcina lacustris]|uniref:hypothetical protein n=1 Tax=Methanosarcina lacustris TaxID=170861 RepID=UPI00064EE640|nr:hypothetical protein [Methanosarcina lacustris]
MIIHFGFLLPVTGSSIAYGRNGYPMPDPHKTQGTSKSGKSFLEGKKGEKEKNLELEALKCPQKPQSFQLIKSFQFIEPYS